MLDLVNVLSTLMDSNGRVLVPGFYDDVSSVTEEEARFYHDLETTFDTEKFRAKLGLGRRKGLTSNPSLFIYLTGLDLFIGCLISNSPKDILMRRWREPSLTIHSISSESSSTTLIPHQVSHLFFEFLLLLKLT